MFILLSLPTTQVSIGILAHSGWQDVVVWYFIADKAMKEGERRGGG